VGVAGDAVGGEGLALARMRNCTPTLLTRDRGFYRAHFARLRVLDTSAVSTHHWRSDAIARLAFGN
jgi:hypothetical protein